VAADADPVRCRVDLQRADPKRRRPCAVGLYSAQDRAQPGAQLEIPSRVSQEVVGARLKCTGKIEVLRARAHNQDGHRRIQGDAGAEALRRFLPARRARCAGLRDPPSITAAKGWCVASTRAMVRALGMDGLVARPGNR